MRYASVCSGVEAATLAWEPLGWKPVWFSEIEPFPCAVLDYRYPDVPNIGDMTKIKGEEYYGMVDLLVGGTPCQGFSVAGQQGGLEDERSQLCLTFVDLLRTMQPKWFVWENVPGVFSTNGGRDFEAFIQAVNDVGYGCAWRVLDAQYVRVDGYPRAVPQRRRRVFVVGHIGNDVRSAAEVLFEPPSLRRNTPPCRTKTKRIADLAETSIGTAGANNAVNFSSSSFGNYSETDFGGTLKSSGGDLAGGSENLSVVCYENHANDSRVTEMGECCQSLTSRAGTGGGNLPLVQECETVDVVATVRRLLPIECERLMGFPDNWTRIPWRGKPAEACPDAPRYKACGNSMCVNVMRWVGMRIESVEKGNKK